MYLPVIYVNLVKDKMSLIWFCEAGRRMKMEKKDYAKLLLNIDAVAVRDESSLFTWASGIKSPIYCDNRLVISYPEVRRKVAQGLADAIVKDFGDNFDIVAATATAGIPHGAWVAELLNKPMVYVRSASKEHGKENLIEGLHKKGQRAVLVEDLISTGGSSLKCVEALHKEGVEVVKVYGIFNYAFKEAVDRFKLAGVDFETLTDYPVLLEVLLQEGVLTQEQVDRLKLFSENPRIFTV